MLKTQPEKLISVSDRCKLLVEQLKESSIDPREQRDLVRIREEVARRGETVAQLRRQVQVHQHAKEAEGKRLRHGLSEASRRCAELEAEVARARREVEVRAGNGGAGADGSDDGAAEGGGGNR
jgi:phage gp16-like protein